MNAKSPCLIVAALLCSEAANAQPAAAPPPPPRLEATAQASLLAATGNSSAQSLGLGGDVTFRPDLWTYAAKAAFAQTKDDGDLAARSVASSFRAGRTLRPRLSAFGQYDYLRDRFAGVENRHTAQAGLSYLAVNLARHQLRVDGGLGYEAEYRLAAEDSKSGVGVGGLLYRWRITDGSEVVDEARATLPFSHTGEWKLDQSLSLTAAVTTILSLKASSVVRFVNEPVPGFEQTDTITSVALVLKVRRLAQ